MARRARKTPWFNVLYCGTEWKVFLVDMRKNDGLCVFRDHEIHIASRLKDRGRRVALVHEFLHMVYGENDETSEHVARRIDEGLAAVMFDVLGAQLPARGGEDGNQG